MTIMRILTVFCDAPECADDEGFTPTHVTVFDARREARTAGWGHRKGRDFCPKHLDEPASQS